MASQKFSSFSSLHPNSNILQPKRSNININTTHSPNLSDPVIGRRILGQKGQFPSLPSNNGISHLSTHQLTTLLRNSPSIEASLGNLNGCNAIAAGSPISGCSPCVTTTTSTGTKRAPNTMAKRNARERNRVKQVNQGFQTLRQHIPDSYRMKKMSKVDTLRCALDYIRNLERILQLPEDQGGHSPLSILTSSPNHSTISPSTSLIFSSEEDELFAQAESPSSSFHHHNQSVLSANTSVDKICCDNTELEMDEPVFASGLMTSGHRIIILSSMDSATMTSSSTAYNNAEHNDENSNQENQNLRIKLEPCSPLEELSSVKDTYGVHAIGVSASSAENNGMVTDRILDVDMGMGIISPRDGQSQGHLSDGHSDIENYQENDAPKFQYS